MRLIGLRTFCILVLSHVVSVESHYTDCWPKTRALMVGQSAEISFTLKPPYAHFLARKYELQDGRLKEEFEDVVFVDFTRNDTACACKAPYEDVDCYLNPGKKITLVFGSFQAKHVGLYLGDETGLAPKEQDNPSEHTCKLTQTGVMPMSTCHARDLAEGYSITCTFTDWPANNTDVSFFLKRLRAHEEFADEEIVAYCNCEDSAGCSCTDRKEHRKWHEAHVLKKGENLNVTLPFVVPHLHGTTGFVTKTTSVRSIERPVSITHEDPAQNVSNPSTPVVMKALCAIVAGLFGIACLLWCFDSRRRVYESDDNKRIKATKVVFGLAAVLAAITFVISLVT